MRYTDGAEIIYHETAATFFARRLSVALVLSDPPWNTGTIRKAGQASYRDKFDDYPAEIIAPTLAYARECLTPGGTIAIWTDYRAHPYWCVAADEAGFNRYGEVVVEALLGNPGRRQWPVKHGNIMLASVGEPRFFYDKMPLVDRRSAPKIVAGKTYQGPKRVGSVVQGTLSNSARERTGYPDQKPLHVLRALIACHTEAGDIVCDPYCGSGSTLVAALGMGRGAVGCDEGAAACDVARSWVKRVVAESAQQRMYP